MMVHAGLALLLLNSYMLTCSIRSNVYLTLDYKKKKEGKLTEKESVFDMTIRLSVTTLFIF